MARRGGDIVKLKKRISALQKGFTLIELLVVIGIIAILVAVVAVAVNPGRQFAQARDTERQVEIRALVDAVYEYASENNGNIPTAITATPTNVGTNTGLVNLSATLVPNYLPEIPADPNGGAQTNTLYVIFRDGNRVVASAAGEITPNITLKR